MPATEERFRLLFVCTGNICRSAAAEHLARARLARLLGPEAAVDVRSAGTQGLVGAPMDPMAAEALRAYGVDAADPAQFSARKLGIEQLEGADLVLTATRAHRAAAVSLAPALIRRTFTMREFTRLAAAVDPSRLPRRATPVARMRAAVDEAAQLRGTLPAPATPDEDDVPDPYRDGPEVHAATLALLVEALARPLDLLAAAYRRRP